MPALKAQTLSNPLHLTPVPHVMNDSLWGHIKFQEISSTLNDGTMTNFCITLSI